MLERRFPPFFFRPKGKRDIILRHKVSIRREGNLLSEFITAFWGAIIAYLRWEHCLDTLETRQNCLKINIVDITPVCSFCSFNL